MNARNQVRFVNFPGIFLFEHFRQLFRIEEVNDRISHSFQ